MKKSLIILLCLCYTLVTCGITINRHYCGGKLKSTSLLKITEEGCCGSEEKSAGCCSDKSDHFKIKDNHKLDATQKLSNNKTIIAVINTVVELFLTNNSQGFIITPYHYPPVFYDNPIYLRNKVLII